MINKTLLTYLIIIGATASTGATAGYLGKTLFGQAETRYIGDPAAYQDDAAALLKKYEENPSQNFSPTDLVNIGLEKYRRCENSYSIGIGMAKTIVDQTVRNFQIRNGDTYFEESISKSNFVTLADRAMYHADTRVHELYRGKATGVETGTYPSAGTTFTNPEEYKTKWGKTLDQMFIYILSMDSVYKDKCSIDKSEDEIKVTLSLDVNLATYYYKVQMKNVSGLDSLPVFSFLNHVYTFDKDMNLKYYTVDEKYNASMMGMSPEIRNSFTYYCFPNQYLKIPDLKTNLDYKVN